MKKKYWVLGTIIALVLLLLIGCQNREEDSLQITFVTDETGKEVDTLEFGCMGIDPRSFVAESNCEYEVKPKLLSVTEKKDYTVEYILRKDGKEKTVTKVFHVTDTTPPVISFYTYTPLILKGENPDFSRFVESVRDAMDGELKQGDTQGSYSIDASKVDTAKEGSYPLSVTAKDTSGNTDTKEMTVFVVNDFEYKVYRVSGNMDLQYCITEYLNEAECEELLKKINENLHEPELVHNASKDHYDSLKEVILDHVEYRQAEQYRYEISDENGNVIVENCQKDPRYVLGGKIYEILIAKGYNQAKEMYEPYGCIRGFTVEYEKEENGTVYFSVNDIVEGHGTTTYSVEYNANTGMADLYDMSGKKAESFSVEAS
ncbi:MAG: hypothetical protein IKE59_07575 [Erysipelotrichaceae bacterium]|nr:hypothetical protein [Erysipelotrichaceae bacterium]